eukprot:Pgem_evm1s10816
MTKKRLLSKQRLLKMERKLTLSKTLENTYAYPHDFTSFNEYVESRYSSELVDIILAIKQYRKRPCLRTAVEIYKTYIESGARKEVNIGYELRDDYDNMFNIKLNNKTNNNIINNNNNSSNSNSNMSNNNNGNNNGKDCYLMLADNFIGDENLFDEVNESVVELVKTDLFVPFLLKQDEDLNPLCFSMVLCDGN